MESKIPSIFTEVDALRREVAELKEQIEIYKKELAEAQAVAKAQEAQISDLRRVQAVDGQIYRPPQ